MFYGWDVDMALLGYKMDWDMDKGGWGCMGGENTSIVNLMQNGVLNTMHQVA